MTERARILIAQISDLHIKPPGELAYGKVDTAAALMRCVAELNRFTPWPDAVVISGDLADTPVAQEYDHLRRLLAPLEIPLFAVPGNHDARALLRAAFPDQPYSNTGVALNVKTSVGPLDLLLLDSSVPQKPHGRLDAETLDWLEAALAEAPSRPALIFLHHPPFITGIAHMDVQNLHNAADLAAVVKKHPRVRLIACGHVHRATMAMLDAAPVTICPVPNHAVALDLAETLPPSFRIEPPAFHLHAWFPGGPFGRLVTHVVPIGDFPGPYPFFGPDGNSL